MMNVEEVIVQGEVNTNHAVLLFQAGSYEQAVREFICVYNQGIDCGFIMQVLEEAFYQPNEQEMKDNYQVNRKGLSQYPYIRGGSFPDYEELPFRLFPVSDEIFYVYSLTEDRFLGRYDGKTQERMRCFFETLDQPVRVEDEDNLYNLQFLKDNVRRSEDIGTDNHIYLCYHSRETLERLMVACNLEAALQQEKFVFLVGEHWFGHYPMNFSKEFGIDYESMKPQPLRVEELTRFCLWYKHAYSGNALVMGALEANPHTITYSGYEVHTNSVLQGEPMYTSPAFRSALKDTEKTYTTAQLRDLCTREGNSIHLPESDRFLRWLDDNYKPGTEHRAAFLFRAFFLFLYNRDHQGEVSRIAPLIVFDPHMWDTSLYESLIYTFPYYSALTSMREPVVTFARSYEYGLVVWNKFQTQYILASDYAHAQYLGEKMRQRYYGFRFEDLKQFPQKTCRSICRHLNIPFVSQMLSVDAPATDKRGDTVHGFDTAPLHRKTDKVFSDFDRMRLQVFYEPIHKYYGYPSFDSEEYPLSGEEIKNLFSHPFRFEKHYRELYGHGPKEEELHQWIQDILAFRLSKELCDNVVFPKLLPLEEPDTPAQAGGKQACSVPGVRQPGPGGSHQKDMPPYPSGSLSAEEKGAHVYWLTGLSGAGKTTIGKLWYQHLKTKKDNVVFLDGDILREVFGGDLGFSETDRRKSAMRNARLCAMLAAQGMDVVCCTISMFDSVRQWNREHIPEYCEIYIKASMETLRARDQKKLYSLEHKDVAGIHVAAEEPKHPDLVLENDGEKTPDEQVELIRLHLQKDD